jgi:hypothetical protein
MLSFCVCKKNEKIPLQETNSRNNTHDSLYKKANDMKLGFRERLLICKEILQNKSALNDSLHFLVLNKASLLFGKLNQPDSAIIYTKPILKIIKFKNDKNIRGKVYYKLGRYFNELNKKDSAFYYYNLSKTMFIDLNDSTQIGNRLRNIAILQSNLGDLVGSGSSSVQALKYFNKTKNRGPISAIYNNLALNSREQSLFKEAIYNYEKAIDFADNSVDKILYKNNLANVYRDLKEYSKAILILENLLQDSINNLKTKARVIDNLAYTKWLDNSKENVLKDLMLATSIREKEEDQYGLIASYAHLSDYYSGNDQKKSLKYALKSYQISKKQKNIVGQIEAIDKIVLFQTPQEAVKYYEESIRLRDRLKEAETKNQYKFASIKYNYEQEEKQKQKFKTLSIENKLVAEQENNHKKNILIIGIVLISGLLFFIYRRKQQHKKRILQETYNTETRIAKKLHDELGNDIFNILTKIQNTKFKTQEIINDLDKIYLQTRSISHENDSIETGTNFENYFRDLMASYNSDVCKIILKDLSSLDLNELDTEKQVVFYRVFNELFVNMRKHSKATLVVISCKKINSLLEVVYADNGVGFKDKNIIFKNGIKNMETRMNTIHGFINFENRMNNGLKVVLRLKK